MIVEQGIGLMAIRYEDFPPGALERGLRRVRIEEPSVVPSLERLHDVVIVPGNDALYDPTGRRIDSTKRYFLPRDHMPVVTYERALKNDLNHARAQVTLQEKLNVIETEVLYLGGMWNHFGHFLTDVMSRFWALQHVPNDVPVVLFDWWKTKFWKTPFIKTILEALDLNKDRFIQVDEQTLLRNVLNPIPSIQHAFRIFPIHSESHRRVARALLSQPRTRVFSPAVYLTRSALRDKYRKSDAEGKLEEILSRAGFEIVAPEQLTLIDQVRIFNECRLVAGLMGSAFHTVLFRDSVLPLTTAMLTTDKVNNRYLMIDGITHHDSIYINATTNTVMNDRGRIERIDLDVERAASHLLKIHADCFSN